MARKLSLDAILKVIDVAIDKTVFNKISRQAAGLSGSFDKTNDAIKKTDRGVKGLNNTLGKTTQQITASEQAARKLTQRAAQFAILLPTFTTLNRAIQGSVKFLFEFDSALRDIVRVDVRGLSDQIEEIGDAALKTAVDFGTTGTEVLNTIRVFKQAGDTIEESQQRARAAILATQISTLSAAQATEVFIAASRQFGAEGENSAAVLDKLAKVEDIAAVNAADVAEAFRTGGNALAEFSGSIDDSIGLIAALREQTRKSGREVGTFFKTLQTRLFAEGDARSALEALGVEAENLDGSLRPTLDVLNDLKAAFDGLTQAQRANAAKAIAGVRQFESLVATLNSLDAANRFAAESANAAGTAEEKRLITDEKLERQLGRLIAQGQAFSEALGDAGFEDAIVKTLNAATALLEIFTNLVTTVGDLGGNLAPLLALGGFQLTRNVLGFSGSGPDAKAPGGKDFIGPVAPATKDVGVAFKSLGQRTQELRSRFTGAIDSVRNFSIENVKNTKTTGLATKVYQRGLQGNVVALKNFSLSLAKTTANNIAYGQSTAATTARLGALTAAAVFLPDIANSAAEGIRSFGGETADIAADVTSLAGSAGATALQFSFLGPVVAAVAGTLSAVGGAFGNITKALKEEKKAIEELVKIKGEEAKVESARFALLGGGTDGAEAQATFVDVLKNAVEGVELGQPLNKAINEGLTKALSSVDAFQGLGLSLENLREALLQDVDAVDALVNSQSDYLASIAESNNRTSQFAQLQQGLADGTLSAGDAFGLLIRTLGAGEVEISEISGNIKRALDFDDVKANESIFRLTTSLRELGIQLELAQLGPDALGDDLVRLRQEFLTTQTVSSRTQQSLQRELNAALEELDEVVSRDFSAKGQSVTSLISKLVSAPDEFRPEKVEELRLAIEQLGDGSKKAASDILGIVQAQIEDRLRLQEAENAVLEEQNRRRRALFEAEATAAQNAFEATRRFSAELVKFGDSVDTGALSAFQNVGLGDVDAVLAGQSDLSQGVQDLILNAFADPVAQAQRQLQVVTADTQAELDILASRLDNVTAALADEANAAEKAALTAEKRSIELAIETTEQQGAVAATDAKIKILEAERQAAEEAAEAERARLAALEALADASREFNDELRDINRSFDDFVANQISSLLDEEANARQELQEAQQEVIESTQGLADAYADLIQAQLDYNGAIADAKVGNINLAIEIGKLTGGIKSLGGELATFTSSFVSVLDNANLSLEKRIQLEQELAQGTLQFLQQAKDEIVGAGLGIFGQSAAENQALGQGIAGLQFVAEQLGGSFAAFQQLGAGEIAELGSSLLNLPVEFKQQIIDALQFLPSTTSIGGFSIEQLEQAIGQIGAGVAPDQGLPSIEDLNSQQVQQLTKLQDLALQDAQLQFSQVVAAQEQVALAEEQLDAAEIAQERAEENLVAVRDAVIEQKAVLDAANEERRALLDAVVLADDKNTLLAIEKQAQAFADQNSVFRDVGDQIVQGISSAIGSKLAVIEAAVAVGSAVNGFIPNFAGGNLTPGEAAGVLRAASREKKAMPGGAGLAVANTSEAIIPMRNKGFVPNFQEGNFASPISAGIDAIKSINETVVAAIARSVTEALNDVAAGGPDTTELLQQVISELQDLNDTSDEINDSNTLISSNTATTAAGTGATGTTAVAGETRIVLETNQNNTITVTGLEQLRDEIENAVRDTTNEQVSVQLDSLLSEFDSVITTLQERGLLSSFGQPT